MPNKILEGISEEIQSPCVNNSTDFHMLKVDLLFKSLSMRTEMRTTT